MEKEKKGPVSDNSKKNAAGKNANATHDNKANKNSTEMKGFDEQPSRH